MKKSEVIKMLQNEIKWRKADIEELEDEFNRSMKSDNFIQIKMDVAESMRRRINEAVKNLEKAKYALEAVQAITEVE